MVTFNDLTNEEKKQVISGCIEYPRTTSILDNLKRCCVIIQYSTLVEGSTTVLRKEDIIKNIVNACNSNIELISRSNVNLVCAEILKFLFETNFELYDQYDGITINRSGVSILTVMNSNKTFCKKNENSENANVEGQRYEWKPTSLGRTVQLEINNISSLTNQLKPTSNFNLLYWVQPTIYMVSGYFFGKLILG